MSLLPEAAPLGAPPLDAPAGGSVAMGPCDWTGPAWGVSAGFTDILKGALDAFSELGYHGASVRDIAGRVGVNVPSLYYRHGSKEALLSDILCTSIDHLHAVVSAAGASSSDPATRFRRMYEGLLRFSLAETKVLRLSAEIRSMTPERRQAYVDVRQSVEARLVAAADEAAAAGDFGTRSPAEDVRAILGMTQAISMWFRPDGRLGTEGLAQRYLTLSRRVVLDPPRPTTSEASP